MQNPLFDNSNITIELENNILIATMKNVVMDLSTAKLLVQDRLNATNYVNYPLISNVKSVKKITKEARDFLASEEGCEGIIAAGILIDSDIGSMIGNFWIKINKPLRPTKLFTDELSAKKWLAQFVEKE